MRKKLKRNVRYTVPPPPPFPNYKIKLRKWTAEREAGIILHTICLILQYKNHKYFLRALSLIVYPLKCILKLK